jgi:hypothetical protein
MLSESVDIYQVYSNHFHKDISDKYGDSHKFNRFFLSSESDKEKEKETLFNEEIEEMKFKFISQLEHDLKFSSVFEDLVALEKKSRSQIERLISNSTLNLIIGIITSIIAICILGYSIFKDNDLKNTFELLNYYIPRITTVLFVEILSFFFLKLYRRNLEEIKYYQNEITNLNYKMSSLKVSLSIKNSKITEDIIQQLCRTERNKEFLEIDKISSVEVNKSYPA